MGVWRLWQDTMRHVYNWHVNAPAWSLPRKSAYKDDPN